MRSHDGLFCTGETYKNVVKMTFSGAPPWMTPQISSILVVIGRQTGAKTRNRRWDRSAIQTPFKTKRGVLGVPLHRSSSQAARTNEERYEEKE